VIDRCGQTWLYADSLYLVLSSERTKHKTLDLETGLTRTLWEFREHEWGQRGHCAGMRRIA